jgi:hypothetical protein
MLSVKDDCMKTAHFSPNPASIVKAKTVGSILKNA